MHIRLATNDDIPDLCELLALLFAQEAEFRPDRGTQARGLEQIIGNRVVGDIFVACDGGRAVGMVSLFYSVSTALGAPVATLEDMVVLPTARAAGVGSALLDTAIAHARTQGCRRITLLTDRDNQPAQRFYGRHGFAHSPMIPLRLKLD